MSMDAAPQPRQPLWLVVPAGVLLWHAASGPNVWDSGELVAAAAALGGSHPPGQPLHALLGHAATLLPVGPMPLRVALLSVAGQVCAAWLLWALTTRLLAALAVTDGLVARWAPHGAAMALLLAPPVLRSSTRVEVYGLALALTLAALHELVAWAEGHSAGLRRGALLAGLAAAVHPPHGLAAVLFGAAVLVVHRRAALPRLKRLGWATSFCVLGLMVYALLPSRAIAGAPMWGDPTTSAGFVDYITAQAYRQNLGTDSSWLTNAADVASYTVFAAGLVAGLGALVLAARARHLPEAARRLVWVLLIALPAALVSACLQPLEVANADNVAYAAPAVALLILAGVLGFALAARGRGRGLALAGIALLASNPAGAIAAPEAIAVDAPALETLAATLVDTPAPRAFVLLETDFPAASWMMAREVDGARPDVAFFVTGLATSSWHWRTLAEHPAFDGEPVRGEGPTTRSAYVAGALTVAARAVEIAAEPDAPVGGRGAVAGPYLLLSAAHAGRRVADESSAEQLERELGRGLASTAPDDAAAILRRHGIQRARRLARRGLFGPSFEALRRALPFLPSDERALIAAPPDARMTQPAVLVRDPNAMLPSRQDTLREVVIEMSAAGAHRGAFALLERQAGRGDARATLQLGWLELRGGRPVRARAALEAFIARAPDLAPEGEELRAALGPAP